MAVNIKFCQMLYVSVWGNGDSISACMLICMPLNLPLYTRDVCYIMLENTV